MFDTVSSIDELDDLFAPVMLEIDVDVRRFVPVHRNEAVEEQCAFLRVDFRYLEAIADDRIRRRAAPLAQNLEFIAGVLDNLVNRKEVGGIVFISDELQFIIDLLRHLGRDTLGIALCRSRSRQSFEGLLWRFAGIVFRRVIVLQLLQRKSQPVEKDLSILDRIRIVPEDPDHFT